MTGNDNNDVIIPTIEQKSVIADMISHKDIIASAELITATATARRRRLNMIAACVFAALAVLTVLFFVGFLVQSGRSRRALREISSMKSGYAAMSEQAKGWDARAAQLQAENDLAVSQNESLQEGLTAALSQFEELYAAVSSDEAHRSASQNLLMLTRHFFSGRYEDARKLRDTMLENDQIPLLSEVELAVWNEIRTELG